MYKDHLDGQLTRWGEAWLWLSAHREGDGDVTDGNDTAWRWDWVLRPRAGGQISGVRLLEKSGKKVFTRLNIPQN